MVYILFWMKPGMLAFVFFVYICMVYICIAIGGRITQIRIPQTALILLHCCVPSLASIWISISTCRTIFVLNYLRWEVVLRFANIGGIIGLFIFHDAYGHVHSTICCRIQYWWLHQQFIIYYNGDDYTCTAFYRLSVDEYVYVIWMWIDWYRKYQPAEPECEAWRRVSEADESQALYSVEQADNFQH